MQIVLFHYYSHNPTPAYQELASALRCRGHKVWLGEPDRAGDLLWQDGEGMIQVTRGPQPVPKPWKIIPILGGILRRLVLLGFIRRVRRVLKSYGPDVVQVNHASLGWLAAIPLFMPKGMYFVLDFRQVGQRGATDPVGRLKGWLTDLYRRVCSRYIYDRACFLHPAGARKILGPVWQPWGDVVPLGVSPAFLALENDASSRGKEPVRFLYVGTLSRVRHLEQLIRAAREVASRACGFRLVLMGNDAADGFYHDLVRDLDLESAVSLKPPVPYEKEPATLASHDVALAYVPERPAHWQYHPTLKALEYRAAGMPIMASDNEPNRDIVQPGVNGLLVENSPGSLAEGMARFVHDPGFLRRCRAGAQQMRSGVTWMQVASLYEQVYLKLLRQNEGTS